MAEAPPAANRIESSTSKEEGELSSDVGGDAEFHEAVSVSPSADCAAAPVKTVDSEAANKGTHDTKAVNKGTQGTKVVNKGTQDTKAESLAVKSTSSTKASSKTSQHQQTNHHSNHEKTRVPFVISFSDDDSGSDSDDTRHDTSVGREHTQVAGTSRKPPVSSVHKSQKAVEAKSAKASFSRAFVSGASKPNGSISRRGGQIRGHKNALNFKKIAERSHSRKFNAHINTRKQQLQDLRQLIAFRESQLKVKPSQQTNITVPVKVSSHLKRFCREASGDELQCHMTESNKKRLKTGELQTNRLDVDCPRNINPVDQRLTSGKCVENSDNSCKVVSRVTSRHALLMPPNNDQKQSPFPSEIPCAISKEGARVAFDSNSNVKASMPAPSDNNDSRGKKAADSTEYSMREINCMNAQDEHMSMQNNFVSEKYLMEASHQDQVKAKVLLDDRTRDSALHAPDTGQRETMNISCFLNGLDEPSLLNCKNDDVKSLLDLEDLLDKELDEAQKHRRNCEIEERNALMAYRKAQRALAEASARCSHIYRKRELFSTQLRCRMMENPNLFFTSRDLDDIGVGLNLNSISNHTMQPNPTSSRDMQMDNSNKQGHENRFLTNTSENLIEKHADKQDMVSVEFCMPDGSSFKAHKECDRSMDVCQSDDEDGESLHHRSLENSSGKSSDLDGGSERGINNVSERQVSSNDPQDSLLLEASLRSQLFEKLKMKKLAKRESQTTELVSVTRNEHDDGGIRMGMDRANAPSPELRLGEQSNPEDVNKEEVSSMPLVQIMRPVDICRAESATPPVTDPMCCSFPFEGYQMKTCATILCPTIKSAFLHMKVLQSIGLQRLPPTTDTVVPDEDLEDVDQSVDDGHKKMSTGFLSDEETLLSLFVKQPGYYSCNFAIDASRPLCMYELRGKCNNDECSWQHIRDYACDNREHDTVDTTDYRVGKKPETDVYISGMLSKSLTHLVLAPPTYVVGSDVLKHDSLHVSSTAQGYGNCWRKCFSSFLVLSSLCPTVSICNEPFLHGTEARIEIHGDLTRQSSYFQSRNVTETQADHYFEDAAQSLEVALHSFCKETNSSKQRLEALNVLARALETNQSSVALWIVYLLIYYSNQKSIGKDDLFQCAVEYNKECYELWILFINSRVRLDDRLAAYQAALCALSSNKYASDKDSFLASQCILDILLQMMDTLCISGNVGKAIEKISGLFSSKDSGDRSQLSTQDIIIPSELCDKVIFWLCCVYLILYKKLPDPIVHSFECWKEPTVFDWPDVQLTSEEKLEASSLTELAVESLVLCMDHESVETEKKLRAAHVFAINHVRCVSVLEGLDCSRKLLEKYVELYPSCVELVLMSARSEYHMSDTSFDGFEDALRSWPVEVPGKQCIWNQYFECALQSDNTDFLKELMERWIQESNKVGLHSNDESDDVRDLLQSSVSDVCARFPSDFDKAFGILNFSLYKRLQNDYSESRFALEHALKTTSADYYHHCLRELSLFILTDGIHHTWHDKVNSVLDILNVSLIDERVLSASEPLSRSFLQTIPKPTVRQLASKLLMPISANFNLMNSVLELWSGVLLLPEVQNKIMDMIDFIEAMMEVLPSNYLLAMSVCKQLKKGSVSVKSSPSISFWATSLLVNALFRAVPVAPEYCWVEAVDVLHNLACFDTKWESFHKKALSVYPFSIKLWRSYLRFSESAGSGESVKAEAQERGIEVK